MKKIHGSKNKRWKCQHLSCLNMLLIIQIFLPWSQWLQNESLYFLPQMKTEFLLLSNPMCFHPNYEKRRSRGGQMRCSQWNNNVRWQWWFFNMSTANSCFYPTFYFMIPPTAMLCVLSPPTPHTSPDMTDGRNDKKWPKRKATQGCGSGRAAGGGVAASLGAALPCSSCSGPGRNRVPEAATVIAALYKCTRLK